MNKTDADILFTEDTEKSLEDITLDDLQEFKEAYYEGNPKISDEEYDEIVQKKFGGHDPLGYDVNKSKGLRFEVKEHAIRMKGQSKVLSWEEYQNWLKEMDRYFGKELEYLVQWKLDGLSLDLEYEHGQLKTAILRGDGATGEDIISSAIYFKGVKKLIPYKDNKCFVRGEIVITQEDFEKIPLEKKANRRNVAAGVARRLDPEHAHYLSFVAWGVEFPKGSADNTSYDTEASRVTFLNEQGFNVVKTIRSSQFTEQVYLDYGDKRDKLDLLIDGMVIKMNDLKLKDTLAEDLEVHQGQTALKFPAVRKASILKRVEWITGKTGKVVPTGIIEPVEILGSVIERVTLCSLQEIERLDLQINEKVWIEKRGDVIPKVQAYDSEYASNNDQVPIEIPDRCPSCNQKLKRKGADLYCSNPDCKAQLGGRLEAAFKALDIKGFGEKVCDNLVEARRVRSISDIFYLQPEDLMNSQGYSLEFATELIDRIKTRIADGLSVAEIISVLQIPNIGETAGAKIQDEFNTIDDVVFAAIMQGDTKKFIRILGESAGIAFYSGILNYEDDINRITDAVVVKKVQRKDDSEYHGAFCFTGFRDKDLSKRLDDLGYKPLSSVTKQCTLLVSKDTTKLSGKMVKAQKNGCRVISLAQLMNELEAGTL